MKYAASLFALLLIMNLSIVAMANGNQCSQVLADVSAKQGGVKERAAVVVGSTQKQRAKYFADIKWILRNTRPEIRGMLSKINNELGTDIEIMQALSFLSGVESAEAKNLNNIQTIDNAVIYGSTNVPLYTLVAQIFLTASFSKNVWVRTPEATRDIYIELFKLFKENLPPKYTQNIHLITESYDTFNRVYVMGLNSTGKQVVRPPSEVVILTGSPETARTMIERNIRNLHKISNENVGRKQLFLGFLAGINPAVVVPSARNNMTETVKNLTFPFLVNGGQDCMNSDVVFAHQTISAELQQQLLAKFKTIKMTINSDREAGITPLTMTKSFDKLMAYREKYERYLMNPEAVIDPEKKTVQPHLFVIPFSEFKNLDLQEHFAPFMTVVTFDSAAELSSAALDPRMQRKAMYALVFGDNKKSPDVEKASDIFKQANHAVVTNSHLYNEYDMNVPFGGLGPDSSMSVLANIHGAGQVSVQSHNRPLLISAEVVGAFPATPEGQH